MLIFCILNLVFCLVASVGNLLVLSALWKVSSIPSTLRKLFLNLVFSDLAVGLIPQLTFGVITGMMLKMVANGNHDFDFFCPVIFTIYHFSLLLLASASFLTIIAIALDRFLAISLHLRYCELVTSNRVAVVLVSLWLTSGACASIFILIPQQNLVVVVVVELVGLFAATAVFVYVSKVVRYHQNQILRQYQLENGRAREILREKKSFINARLVFAVLLVCYVPNLCSTILLLVNKFRLSFRVANQVTVFLVFLNSSLNTVVYCWRYQEIRKHIKRTLKNIFRINLTV